MSEPLRVVLAGGGTGGHIYPLVALAREILRRQPEAGVVFVGERGRMEADLLPTEGFTPELLALPPVAGPRWRRLGRVGRWLTAYRAARALLVRERAQVVVGAGGQVCLPVLLAARRLGVPRVILEPNAIPGRANRLLARWTAPELIGVLMPAAVAGFAPLRAEVVGYPIRPAILTAERASSAAALGLDPARTTVLVFGGSLGSEHLNEALVELLPTLTDPRVQGVQFLHLGGRVNARSAVGELPVAYHYRDYLHEMHHALAAADLVVGRAGAMSLAELTARGLPAILIPFPAAADDHQTANARWLTDAGAAVVVPDAELTPERLRTELLALLTEPDRLAEMAAASRRLGRPNAAAELVDRLLTLVEKTSRES